MRIASLTLFIFLAGCANNDYQFERIDGESPVVMPLKFEGLSGRRDADSVTAEARFAEGGDSVTMNINIHLGPPAVFRSGTYRAIIGGKTSAGTVDCPSLNYLGGQNTQPSVGGLFRLKDEQNRSTFQVRIPTTVMTRQQQR